MKYVEQTKTPYEYYLKALKDSIYSIANGNVSLAENFYNKEVETIEKDLIDDLPVEAQSNPNHPKRLLRTAQYISETILLNALTIKSNNNTNLAPCYALEYFTYDFENQFSGNKPYSRNEFGYYDDRVNTFWTLIKTQQSSKKLLTAPNAYGYYNVINFNKIHESIQSIIKDYYSQCPDMLSSVLPDKRFQKKFGILLGQISSDIVKNKNYSTSFEL